MFIRYSVEQDIRRMHPEWFAEEGRIYRPAPTEERPTEYERPTGYSSTNLIQAGGAAAAVGGQEMADAETLNTLRGEAAFIIPEEFKRFLPLILLFLLFALVIFKK